LIVAVARLTKAVVAVMMFQGSICAILSLVVCGAAELC
jgi:hypothetical protein